MIKALVEKAKREQSLAEMFCLRHGDAKFNRLGVPPEPDVLMTLRDLPFGLELTAYHKRDSRILGFAADTTLRQTFSSLWKDNKDVQTVSVYLRYCENQQEVQQVPRKNAHADICAELLRLVRDVRDKLKSDFKQVVFYDPTAHVIPHDDRYLFLEVRAYPLLSSSCRHLRLTDHPEYRGTRLSTSLSFGRGGLDKSSLRQRIEQKVAKLGSYRASVPHAKMGLLIHAEVWPPTSYIHDAFVDEALSSIQQAHTDLGLPFDGVWFMRFGLSGESHAELHSVFIRQ